MTFGAPIALADQIGSPVSQTGRHEESRVEPLDAVLANRRWIRARYPFPHVRAHDVLGPETYATVEASFKAILARGLAETPAKGKFARNLSGYDAYTTTFPEDRGDALWLFLRRAWHDMLAAIFGVAATGDVSAGLHHHMVGSSSGEVHNDLNPGWFIGEATPHTVNLSANDRCNYKFGTCRDAEHLPRQTVRAVALIYYLANARWRAGDGGETGLYEERTSAVDKPAVAVPPINNSLVAFECTPYSFHAFISNRRQPRNSLVFWLHRPYEEAAQRWGERRIVIWKR